MKGDFFPYCDLNKDKVGCWTGYYTTRPAYKKLSRIVDSNLRAAEILFTLTINTIMSDNLNRMPDFFKLYRKLIRARRVSALFQHHDGITGTSKQYVMEYYRKSLLASLQDLKFVQKSCISIYYNLSLNNISDQEIIVPAKLIVFNSLAKIVNADVSVVVNSPYISVSYLGSEVDHQIVPQPGYNDKYSLVFYPTLSPLSITIFEIYPSRSTKMYCAPMFIMEDTFSLINNFQKLYFLNGLLNFIEIDGQMYKVILKLKGYQPVKGKSGAYLFKPFSTIWSSDDTYKSVTILNGQLFDEVYTKLLYVTLITRLYKYGDLANLVEISIESLLIKRNIEVIMQLEIDMNDNAKWYTDVNDFQCRQRVNVKNLYLEGNYYPMTSIVYVENEIWRLAIIADHSHGTNYHDGKLEIMLNRRISTDDGKGIGEGILDDSTVTSKFYLFVENSCNPPTRLFSLTKIINYPLQPYLFDNNYTLKSVKFLDHSLENHLHLLNFRTLSKNLNQPSKDALLILQNYHSSQTVQPFQTGTPFTGVRENKLLTTTITGVKIVKEIDSFDEIVISPSSLTTLKISF